MPVVSLNNQIQENVRWVKRPEKKQHNSQCMSVFRSLNFPTDEPDLLPPSVTLSLGSNTQNSKSKRIYSDCDADTFPFKSSSGMNIHEHYYSSYIENFKRQMIPWTCFNFSYRPNIVFWMIFELPRKGLCWDWLWFWLSCCSSDKVRREQ